MVPFFIRGCFAGAAQLNHRFLAKLDLLYLFLEIAVSLPVLSMIEGALGLLAGALITQKLLKGLHQH